jgi:riboflavin kinase/FMN adenylyltransferase
MQIFYNINSLSEAYKNAHIAIGKFDGMHLAHQKLIHELKSLKPGPHGLLLFYPDPKEIIDPNFKQFYLSSQEQKLDIINYFNLDFVIIQYLDASLLNLSAEDFVIDILGQKLGAQSVVVGENFRFGKGALAGCEELKRLSHKEDISVHVLKDVMIAGKICSSSVIRDYLRKAKLENAQALLGRFYSVRGRVQSGQRLGRTLGFPTANIKPAPGFGLRKGVYASVLRFRGTNYVAATNVGVRPTVSDTKELLIETHCLDCNEDFLDQEVEVFFIKYLRDELKFPSLKSLQEVVNKDLSRLRLLHLRFPELFHDPSLFGRWAEL